MPAPAPPPDRLLTMVKRNASALGRVGCGGCPERWETQACYFTEELLRAPDALGAARCAVVQPPVGVPGLPERLPAAAAQAVASGKATLAHATGRKGVDQALALYALGADLQRLGSLDLWVDGLHARAAAVGWLAEARPDDRWPAELLALEASAPAPSRVTDVAVLASYNRLRDPDWSARAGIGRASKLSGDVVRMGDGEREAGVREVRQSLSLTWPEGQLPVDLVDAWQAAELVRDRSIEVALAAALAQEKRCPADLHALVPTRIPSVPEGWSVDPATCTPMAPPSPPPAEVPAVAGALAAEP